MDKKFKKTKKELIELKINSTYVQTFDGKKTLGFLINSIGVNEKVEYFNLVEKPLPKRERTINNRTHIVEVTHDYGLKFNNGFEIKHVDRDVFNYVECNLKRVRERK